MKQLLGGVRGELPNGGDDEREEKQFEPFAGKAQGNKVWLPRPALLLWISGARAGARPSSYTLVLKFVYQPVDILWVA